MFTVYGKCTPKGRPRFFRKGNFVGTYTDAKTKDAEQSFLAQAIKEKPEKPLEGAIKLTLEFRRVTPKTATYPWWITRPDIDNFIKQALDNMNGIFFKDDAQVVQLHVYKLNSDEYSTSVIMEELK